jgi:hypothetical protein
MSLSTITEMQSQMKSLISAFSGIKEEARRGNMAETLYSSGLVRKIENEDKKTNDEVN